MINKSLMPKAYTEVLEILKYIPKSEYNKIPKEIIENMQLNSDKEYKYEITNFDNFQNQNMLNETEAILAVIFRDYWATPYQKERIKEKELSEEIKNEKQKREEYNPDSIFKDRLNNKQNETKIDNNLPIEVKKDNFFIALIKHIKNLFSFK